MNGKKVNVPAELRQSTAVNGESFELSELQVGSTLKVPSRLAARRDVMLKASVARYHELEAEDATDRLINALLEGIGNGAMLSMQYAAESDSMQVRTEELKNATRAIREIRDLVEARDKRRGSRKQRVISPGLNVQARPRDPMERLYEEVNAIRHRLDGTNPLPVKERSPIEILASLPEEEYRALFAPVLRHKVETQTAEKQDVT
jgi:hypothetical protein